MSIDTKMLMLRTQLYTAIQVLEGDKLQEFWDLIDEIMVAGGRLRRTVVAPPDQRFMSEDGKTIFYWPYCRICHQPYSFSDDEPIATCECGSGEWGYPRPAEWISDPADLLQSVKEYIAAADKWAASPNALEVLLPLGLPRFRRTPELEDRDACFAVLRKAAKL